MSGNGPNTEELILQAAKVVFVQKGFEGTRMQDIAEEAGINKALLHYYYRSKEKLFNAVFLDAFMRFMPKMKEALASDWPLEIKIQAFCNNYITLLKDNPHLPVFILHEIHRNPDKIVDILRNFAPDPHQVMQLLEKELEGKNLPAVKPLHLMVNLVAMCIFPFAARPILQGFLFGNDAGRFEAFLEERKTEIPKFFMNAISE